MPKTFVHASDSVHAVVVKDDCTRMIITKEWIGLHALQSFTNKEWSDLTEQLRKEGLIEPQSQEAA